MSPFYIALLTLLASIVVSEACFSWGNKDKLTKSDCYDFPHPDFGCKRIFLGKRQTEDLALGMYRTVAEKNDADQVNFLLVPLELSRVISALIHAVGKTQRVVNPNFDSNEDVNVSVSSSSEEEESAKNVDDAAERQAVEHMRCYVRYTEKELGKTILAEQNEDENTVDTDVKKGNKTSPPRMLMVQRRLFVDETLKTSTNYSKQALCWYDIEIQQTKLGDAKVGAKDINKWAKEQHKKALKVVSNMTKSDPARKVRRPLAGDTEHVKGDRAVVASSIYLKVAFKHNLFSTLETKPSEPFFVKLRGDKPHADCDS